MFSLTLTNDIFASFSGTICLFVALCARTTFNVEQEKLMSTCLVSWQYAKYLELQNSIEGVRNVYRRACDIHLPKKPYIHLAWAAFEERQGKAMFRKYGCAMHMQ